MKFTRVVRQKIHTGCVLVRRTVQALKEDGVQAAGQTIKASLIGFLPARRRASEQKSPFDEQFNVDTAGVVRIASLDISSPNYIHARYYKASNPEYLRDALGNLGIDYRNYTFLDFGSGKGLALLVASEYPFRHIIGLEFGAELHRIAEQNIGRYRSSTQQCRSIRSVCADATTFELPGEPLVCYFYEPFEAPVLKKVLDNFASWIAGKSKPLIIIYHGAGRDSALHRDAKQRDELFEAQPYLTRTRHDVICSVYESRKVRTNKLANTA